MRVSTPDKCTETVACISILSHCTFQVWQLSGILGRVSRFFRAAANNVARYYEAPDSALLEDFLKVLHPMTWDGDDDRADGDELKLATEEPFERVKPVKFEGAEIISAVLVQSDDGIGSLVPDVHLENSGEEESEAHVLADKLREDGHGELADMVEKIAKEVDHALEYELDKKEVERGIGDSKAAADKLRAAGLTEEAALMVVEMVVKLEEALQAHQELEWCSEYGYACFCEVKLKIALPINDDMQQLSDLLTIRSVLSVDEEALTVDLRWIPTTEKAYIETKLERAKAAHTNEFTIRQGADGWFVRARITETRRSKLIAETSVVLWERNFSRMSSPELSALWEGHMHSVVREGVSARCDSFVKPYLVDSLNNHVDHLASVERCDYHPNSGEIVRGHLHPAMYPYIRGVTETVSLPPQLEPGKTDMWGRIYEDSIYQWLPTQFGE